MKSLISVITTWSFDFGVVGSGVEADGVAVDGFVEVFSRFSGVGVALDGFAGDFGVGVGSGADAFAGAGAGGAVFAGVGLFLAFLTVVFLRCVFGVF